MPRSEFFNLVSFWTWHFSKNDTILDKIWVVGGGQVKSDLAGKIEVWPATLRPEIAPEIFESIFGGTRKAVANAPNRLESQVGLTPLLGVGEGFLMG